MKTHLSSRKRSGQLSSRQPRSKTPRPITALTPRDCWPAALEEIGRRRTAPQATYRVQLHAGFRFPDAQAIVPYLAGLGISDCSASPYLKAAPGSTHGYDITDHGMLNPEVGTADEHSSWLTALRDHGLGLLLDVVPNHMGILGNENPWWNDVLENGQASPYARYFDIDWAAPTRPENRGRVLLPFLGDLFGEILEQVELRLGRDGGAFHVQYHEHRFPLHPKSYRTILEPALQPISAAPGAEHEAALEYQSVLTAIRNLPEHTESSPQRVVERHRERLHEEGLAAQTVGWDEIEPVLRDKLARQTHDEREQDSPSLYVVVEKILGMTRSFRATGVLMAHRGMRP